MAKEKAKEHSKNFTKVKDYYERGLWTEVRVRAIVDKWITADEYKDITGKDCDMA